MFILQAFWNFLVSIFRCLTCQRGASAVEGGESAPLVSGERSATYGVSSPVGQVAASFTSDEFVSFYDQKAWVLAWINLIVYFGVSVLMYTYVLDEKFTVIDSIYFAVVTCTTVG